MKDYESYIFDLDGTLISSLDDLALSCNYALRSYGMPERSLDEVRQFVGNGVKKLIERAIPDGLNNVHFNEVYDTIRSASIIFSIILIQQRLTLVFPNLFNDLRRTASMWRW